MSEDEPAACRLLGLTLPNGWKVIDRLEKTSCQTGGTFSQSYLAERSGSIGFVKAFDFSAAFDPGIDTTTALQSLTASFNHERQILEHCRSRRLSNVVVAIDSGEVAVPGMGRMEGRVVYLIFERAAGDIRVQMDLERRFDAAWCFAALKDVCLALWQIHKEMIAHQDAKPSNVLCYGQSGFKISDFGRASWRGSSAPHDQLTVAGDKSYAPPELLYGHAHEDFVPRRIGCDLYMLGNLAAFLFSGVNVTASMFSHLDPQHHPRNWGGGYREVLPYLQNAFAVTLEELVAATAPLVREEISSLVSQLCQPDLNQRGHPKGFGRPNQYSLERYVSQLDLGYRRLAIRLRSRGRAA